jgi:sterol desaturase/sphingolipid hydroxylase (fatty acid hydroxylase superfamily)
MEYLKQFTAGINWGNFIFMLKFYAASTLAALVIEGLCLKHKSTIYGIYKGKISKDLKYDAFMWLMEISLLWPLVGKILTLCLGVYVGSIINSWAFNISSVKLIPMVPSLVLQVFLTFALGDFVFYWLHRAFHVYEPLWQLHKYHHSIKEMTVISGARDIPAVGQLMAGINGVLPAFLGSANIVPAFVTFIGIMHSHIIHSKISHDWGYIGRYFIVSPHGHLVHHSMLDEHLNKNFAAVFPIYDHLFGTFYSGKNKDVSCLGVRGEDQNAFFIKQILINTGSCIRIFSNNVLKFLFFLKCSVRRNN